MAAPSLRSADEWFQEAARCYVEEHQGCAWCGGRHRVFKSERDGRSGYYCHACDFYVCREEATERCFMAPGDALTASESPYLVRS